MEGKKLKYPKKRIIVLMDRDMYRKPAIDFAERYKRGNKSVVRIQDITDYNFTLGIWVPRVAITFYSYEPVGELREAFVKEMRKANWTGAASVDGWLCTFPKFIIDGMAQY